MSTYTPVRLESRGTKILLPVHALPGASRTAVGGVRDGALVVRVTAAPENDKANTAVLRALASALLLPKSALTLVRGQRSRKKTVEIAGKTLAELAAAVQTLAEHG